MRAALIVVDVQNDFLTGTLALKNCPAKEVSRLGSLFKSSSYYIVIFYSSALESTWPLTF